MSTTTDLNTLVINYLTEAQYEAAVQGGTIDPDQLYLTPDAGGGSAVTDVEVDGVSVVTAGVASVDLTGKSDVGHTHTKTDITDFPSLATVATSGSYSDLSNKPSIPTITDTYSGTSSNGMSGKAVKSAIDALDGTISGSAGSGKTLTAFSQTDGKVSATFGNISITKSQVSDFPSLATVATSGSYNDLSDTPTIPTVNNATLTIQKNGTTVKTFTANASSNVTANITVPTAVSELSNDSGFITDAGVTSFNGSTGAITYTAPVTSVNGSTGAVTLSIPTITDTYSGTSSNGMSGKAVKSAIDALDGSVSGSAGAGKTLTAFSQTNGVVSATFGSISITKSQVSDFPTNVSSFTNDSGYLTSHQDISGKADKVDTDINATVTTLFANLGWVAP